MSPRATARNCRSPVADRSSTSCLLRGAAFYDDSYLSTDAGWRIARTGYTRRYESIEQLPESWKLTANR